MSENTQSANKLLLLLKAAKAIDEQNSWDHPYSRSHDYTSGRTHSLRSSHPNSYLHVNNQRKSQTHTRRAHLRSCMEGLKQRLNFEDDSVTRITMLTILKKATSTIYNLRQENHTWENREVAEKKRCNHLMMRRQALRKRLENHERRNKLFVAKFQSWRERNRNFSECSVATTSSEDSELDFAFSMGNPNLIRLSSRVNHPGVKTGSPTAGLSGEECGSDSGYESPKLFRPGGVQAQISGLAGAPITASMDNLCVRERAPVLISGCSGC